ncbi:MAG TPA: hypothetical protein VMN57_10535 [Anaerolineales bacterium]|nr:hypothetical protein [Anaerolineales bacterium]
MKKNRLTYLIFGLMALLFTFILAGGATGAEEKERSEILYRGVHEVVQFDISPRLDSLPPADLDIHAFFEILDDFRTGNEGPLGPQDADAALQSELGGGSIPAPHLAFDALTNIASVVPPDPNGDVGPDHYVAMSNVYFAVYDKLGNLLMGPVANNTLWSGFGGHCQTDNSGDPIVIYDQLADRWLLTQFTSSGPTFFNCVALSTTGDPTGTYFRWAVSTGTNFPDYPKYGVWSDAYYISTREFSSSGPFAGSGAYAMNKADMLAGDPNPTIISFLVTPGSTPYLPGDGLLPADLDGSTLPPSDSPHYFLGSMDNGGPYGAPQDALTLWHFVADWVTPGNSSFTLEETLPIADYDTIFPCSPTSRACIPQPGTSQKIDILSYRQRPIFRLAYRNFGTHESLVTNQSVEASGGIAGNRWWEIRDPGGSAFVYQEGTFAPGVTDGVHRWMGSIAMDQDGNMALGYSASSSSVFPSIWYTGRLATDPLGTMPMGEESIVDGTGSQTSPTSRWGDYTSMVIDPVDDCTFWYTNQWLPTTSTIGWVVRVGAFKFDQCGAPDFTINADPVSQSVCAPSPAVYTIDIGQLQDYDDQVTLTAQGNPAGTTVGFNPNPVTPPGSSTMTIGSTGSASPGTYPIDVIGIAPTSTHTTTVTLNLFTAAPGAPTLVSPGNGATGVERLPTFSWSAASQAGTYTLEVATDPGFSNIVYSASGISGTMHTAQSQLDSLTTHYWRAQAANACGTGATSAVYTFVTQGIPPILLVDDDDDAPDVQSYWTDALDALGWPYEIWVTGGADTEPGASVLAEYDVVLWFSGVRFGSSGAGPAGPSASTETALAAWLNAGGCFFISSQDYRWDKGVTPLMTGYLGVSNVTNDNGDYTAVTGQNVFAGLGPYSLNYPYLDFSDPITIGNGGLSAMLGNNSKVGGATKETDDYRTSYWAFGLEALPEDGREAALQTFLDWCDVELEPDTYEAFLPVIKRDP